MLYLNTWYGDKTDWITVTPENPEDVDSSKFDEGKCTGYKIPVARSKQFIEDYMKLMNKYNIQIKVF